MPNPGGLERPAVLCLPRRAQKVGVMEGGDCEQLVDVAAHLPGHCAMFWLLKAMDIVVDPELLAEVMDRALAKLQAAAAAAGAT